MRKRLLSILLALCMVLCLVPTAVLAADEVSAKVNGIAVPTAGGSITGEGISGSVVFDASAKTLTLENATINVTTEEKAIEIRSGIDTLILKGKNEIKWADESDKKTSIYVISASSSSFLIKGNSREDSLTVTLPGTTGGYKYAYAISMGKCEIRNCSLDITVVAGMQNAGDNVAIRVSDLKVKNAALDIIVGKDRQGNVQKATQGACVFATGRISIENSYVHAGIYSALGQGAAYYATLQGQGGITCTDSVVYAESDVLKAGRTICLDGGDTTFSVKNSIFKAKSNQYAVYGYNHAKPTFESSLVELESEDVVMRGPTFGTISGFTKITATDKNSNVTTYNPGDDLSTLSTDSRKVVIESQIHYHCVCGGENATEGHTVHSPLMWTPWTKTDSLPTAAGNYYLTGNVILKSNSDYSMPDGVQICLNGYTIRGTRAVEDGESASTLYANGGTLTVADCGTRGAIKDIKMSSGELLMYGGRFAGELIIGETGAITAADRVSIGAEVTNKGVIFGGIFNGAVINDGGTIEGGTFNARVDLKSGDVIGGIYHGRVTYGGAVIHDSACRYLTFDTDGGSAMDAQRILRGQKATPPTEKPVKTGYIFSGWTAFDYTKPMLENAKVTAIWTVCDHSGNTTQLTCTEPVACSVCSGTIAALGHDFSASAWQHDGDTHWKKCARCDAKNDENPHDWDSGKVTVPSTCLTEGERIYTCDECGATKNEPIQASGHSWDQAWQHNATHHWHECLNANCDVKNNDSAKDGYGEHTGGTAACTEKAICEYCHQSYGEKDPSNHVGGTQEWTIRTAYVHEQKWSCCGAVIVASEAHEWADGVCSECGYACLHTDADNNHICDICEKIISNHEDADKNHICDYCGKTISNHKDADKNHICDICEKIISNHRDADKDHICDYCEKAISNHEDMDKNHICDYCEKIISNHEDADRDHICDFCRKTISNHEDTDKNHICDYCGKTITNHTGGKATCIEKAVCEVCGKAYGGLDADNHANLKHIEAKAATKDAGGNIEYWYCEGCGKYYSDADAANEITKDDTVTAKLPDDPKSPQTGDNSDLMLWIALLFIGGGVCTALIVKRKKSY